MKKLIVILLIFCAQLQAQEGNDSIVIVKNYLSEIKQTVLSKKSKKAKILKMQQLIRVGIDQREIFERNIRRTKSHEQAEELIRSFNLILQSAILYKNDLAETNADSEVIYLKNNIPKLLKELD